MSTSPIKHLVSKISSHGGAHRSFMLRSTQLSHSTNGSNVGLEKGHSIIKNRTYTSSSPSLGPVKGAMGRRGPPSFAFKNVHYNPSKAAGCEW